MTKNKNVNTQRININIGSSCEEKLKRLKKKIKRKKGIGILKRPPQQQPNISVSSQGGGGGSGGGGSGGSNQPAAYNQPPRNQYIDPRYNMPNNQRNNRQPQQFAQAQQNQLYGIDQRLRRLNEGVMNLLGEREINLLARARPEAGARINNAPYGYGIERDRPSERPSLVARQPTTPTVPQIDRGRATGIGLYYNKYKKYKTATGIRRPVIIPGGDKNAEPGGQGVGLATMLEGQDRLSSQFRTGGLTGGNPQGLLLGGGGGEAGGRNHVINKFNFNRFVGINTPTISDISDTDVEENKDEDKIEEEKDDSNDPETIERENELEALSKNRKNKISGFSADEDMELGDPPNRRVPRPTLSTIEELRRNDTQPMEELDEIGVRQVGLSPYYSRGDTSRSSTAPYYNFADDEDSNTLRVQRENVLNPNLPQFLDNLQGGGITGQSSTSQPQVDANLLQDQQQQQATIGGRPQRAIPPALTGSEMEFARQGIYRNKTGKGGNIKAIENVEKIVKNARMGKKTAQELGLSDDFYEDWKEMNTPTKSIYTGMLREQREKDFKKGGGVMEQMGMTSEDPRLYPDQAKRQMSQLARNLGVDYRAADKAVDYDRETHDRRKQNPMLYPRTFVKGDSPVTAYSGEAGDAGVINKDDFNADNYSMV